MPRAIWNGHLSFGLVQIPVGVFPAEQRDDLSFDLLDRRDSQHVGYSKINKATGEPVPAKEIVKAWEYAPDRYVFVEDADFKRARVESTRTIDVSEFVPAGSIDPLFFERPYYLAPGKGGDKPYRLLAAALKESGQVGIGRIVIRSREDVAAVYPEGDALVLNTLRYPHELRNPKDLDLPKAEKAPPKELAMAKLLIEQMSGEFKPSQYKDRYREEMLAILKKKAKTGDRGLPEPIEPEPETGGKVLDLAALLKKSLNQKRGGETGRAASRRSA
jgi:DNA end-binding protein Ku